MSKIHEPARLAARAECGGEDAMISKLVCKWIGWRYGGIVYTVAPPFGKEPPSNLLLYRLWRIETALFERYGKPMRMAWKAKVLGREA